MGCQSTSETFDPVMYFSVPFPEKIKNKKQTFQLEDLVREYTKSEKLDSRLKCEDCRQNNIFEKKIDLWKAPNILILHLKRFKYQKNKLTKINNLVKFPVENFNIQKYVLGFQRSKPNYNLFAVCVRNLNLTV